MLPSKGDPFIGHFERCLSDETANNLRDVTTWNQQRAQWPTLGKMKHLRPNLDVIAKPVKRARLLLEKQEEPIIGPQLNQPNIDTFSISNYFIKEVIQKNIGELNPMQKEMLSIISNYSDFYYPDATHHKWDDVSQVYCIHAVNHILKTRARVIKNNYKLNKAKVSKTPINKEECRDQGLTRPKVLILLPSRQSCYR